MKSNFLIISFLIFLISCKTAQKKMVDEAKETCKWTKLFNGIDLNGWTANIGGEGDDTSLKANEIFTVSDGKIHVYKEAKKDSRQYNANLYYDKVFSNFHLQVEYRWLDKKFKPRDKDNRDAGVLFHIHNKPERVWPSSVEMQMGDGKPEEEYVSGDLWCIHTLADSPNKDGFYRKGASHITTGKIEGKGYGSSLTSVHAEKPLGEWNTIDIHVKGSEYAMYYLNGTLVNEVYNMRYQDENGVWLPLDKGYISVQGEWAELQYRTIRIKELL